MMDKELHIRKSFRINFIFALSVALTLFCRPYAKAGNISGADHTDPKQLAFEQVFGDAVVLDPQMVQKVRSDKPGKRHYVDRNNDGKPEEVWFIDIDPRHNDRNRPMLVRVIDEDGDLQTGKEPERDSDLYIADWNADGTVDALIDYEDTDGDQDMDRMAMYFYDPKYGLRVWWMIDEGDDNLLDYDIDYIYYQQPCQDHSHFGGDESIISLYYDPQEKKWVPFWENPFLFFDSDHDGVTEETMRIEGEEYLLRYLRWSFNVDPDSRMTRDFDVSISACAPGWTEEKDRESDFNFYLGKRQTESIMIRGIPTGPILRRSTAREFMQKITWGRIIMTWDENDLNIAFNDPNDQIERWEGVIAAPCTDTGFYMPRIGGPNCGPFNKRYELVLKPKSPNEFYFNPADQRIHLKNSDKTWIKVDYDGDLKADMNYSWTDIDHDGIADRISVDADGDGTTDDSWDLDVSKVKPVEWTFHDLNEVFAPTLKTEPENKYLLVRTLAAALESVNNGAGDEPVWQLMERGMRGGNFTDDLARRLTGSDETMLYYLMLVQDRLIVRLKNQGCGSPSFWKIFNAARSKGNTMGMMTALTDEFKLIVPEEDYLSWVDRLRMGPAGPHVAWDNRWLPPNWGWESEKAAFRFYNGHFDLFGKRMDTLIYPGIAEGESYHLDQNGWGMDILHVGTTSGCGGVILYVDGKAYPVRSEMKPGEPTFTCRLAKETPDTVKLEFVAEGIGPEKSPYTVRFRVSAIAGKAYSPVWVQIEGVTPGEKVELGIGLTRLPDETFYLDTADGIIASWGFQEPEIGWIGMGIIFPAERFLRLDDQPGEHRVVLHCEPGTSLTYFIQGDWLRGHQFSCCPVAKDWMDTLKTIQSAITKLKDM